MNDRTFAIKMIVKAIIFIVISAIVLIIFQNPVITNEIALGQMSNSDELYLLMEAHNKVKQYTSIVYGCLVGILAGTVVYDIENFKKNKGENEE